MNLVISLSLSLSAVIGREQAVCGSTQTAGERFRVVRTAYLHDMFYATKSTERCSSVIYFLESNTPLNVAIRVANEQILR